MIKFQLRYNKAFTDRDLLCRNCCLCNENSASLLPVFHLDVAICADHPNLPALCFNRGNPPAPLAPPLRGHTLVALRWTSDEKRRSGVQLSCQREAAKTCLRWNYTAARSAYQTQRAARLTRIVSHILQFMDKRKASERKMATMGMRHVALVFARRGLGIFLWLTGGHV